MIFVGGEFAIYKEKVYRGCAYQHDMELFDVVDIERKQCLLRVNKELLDDCYYEFAYCDYEGVKYIALSIEDGKCAFTKIVNDKEAFSKSLNEINEVWYQRNYKKAGKKIETIYLNECIQGNKPSSKQFYIEQMACGNLMLSYLEELKSINEMQNALMKFYGERIQFEGPDLRQLMLDYYIEKVTIDEDVFCLTEDWGIVTLSPENETGNCYIREIVELFNESGGDQQ